jgi:hypothetical protein
MFVRVKSPAARARVRFRPIMCAVAVALLAAGTASAHQRLFHFEIRQEPLSQALRSYGEICGQDLIFTEDVPARPPCKAISAPRRRSPGCWAAPTSSRSARPREP